MDQTPAFFPEGSLILVWNADSGWQQALLDSVHKWLSPKTYSCDLCRLTHGAVGPKREWAAFLGSLSRPAFFFHRDQWDVEGHGKKLPGLKLPAVLQMDGEGLTVILDHNALADLADLEHLLKVLRSRLQIPSGDRKVQ